MTSGRVLLLTEFIVNVMHIYAAFKVMNLKVRNYIEKVYS